MGFKYTIYRIYYEIFIRCGLFTLKFPQKSQYNINDDILDKWYRNSNIGFFYSREQRKQNFPPIIKNIDLSNLKDRIEKYQAGGKLFFRKKWFYFNGIEWNHNIKTGKNYPMIHWSKINALDRELGDIKYVWERSKFSEIQDYLLYDLITGENQIKYILPDIISWIKCNPINTGPNWFCSQEISLRLINWSFFIHFYKEELYSNYKCELLLIIKSIIDQIIHVRSNINYSRKLVQNNHAFTETATLYIIGNIFSYIKLLNDYKKYGRKSFVQEFNNQIFDEGTDSQYSFNYYRTKIQILSFFIIFDNDEFLVKYRKKLSNISVFFDLLMRDNGMVPNYGANDGSLYFKFNTNDNFDSFSPQIDTFNKIIGRYNKVGNNIFADDFFWFVNHEYKSNSYVEVTKPAIKYYKEAGYLLINFSDVFLFMKAGDHKHRPNHADNSHIDIWKSNVNLFCDSGTYSYNDTKTPLPLENSIYHNVMLVNGLNQMAKSFNFMWIDWTTLKDIKINKDYIKIDYTVQSGIKKKYILRREVFLLPTQMKIKIKDSVIKNSHFEYIEQNWITKDFHNLNRIKVTSDSQKRKVAKIQISSGYGLLMNAYNIKYSTDNNFIVTEIDLL